MAPVIAGSAGCNHPVNQDLPMPKSRWGRGKMELTVKHNLLDSRAVACGAGHPAWTRGNTVGCGYRSVPSTWDCRATPATHGWRYFCPESRKTWGGSVSIWGTAGTKQTYSVPELAPLLADEEIRGGDILHTCPVVNQAFKIFFLCTQLVRR